MADRSDLSLFKRGLNNWNEFRENKPEIRPDLSEIDRSGEDHSRFNLRLANLRLANLIRADLSEVNLREADLTNANLSEANLKFANFTGADLSGIDLSKTNLENANFSGAYLNGANLENANLTRSNLRETSLSGINLNRTQLAETNLTDIDFRQATLISANLSRVDLSRADFYLADLSKAKLTEAKLIHTKLIRTKLIEAKLTKAKLNGADLTHADFTKVDLTEANLSRVQALSANFQEANLTGVCIEHWNINSETNFDNVICEYVYLKQNQQDRRPHNPDKIFAPGEFTKRYQKLLETVDIYFDDSIDWQAFLVSFNKLQIECDSDELSINSFENKGNGAFIIRVNVPDGADKAEIEKYLEKQYQLEAKVESQARELTNLYEVTKLLAGRPINVTTQASGNTYNTETAAIVHHEGDISGNAKIAGVYNENAQQDFTQLAASIQQLIDQLQKTNGVTVEASQQQAAKDLATKATSDPQLKDKLIQLGKFISENSAKTIVSEGVKGAIKLFLLMV